jgi:hypothetical protein
VAFVPRVGLAADNGGLALAEAADAAEAAEGWSWSWEAAGEGAEARAAMGERELLELALRLSLEEAARLSQLDGAAGVSTWAPHDAGDEGAWDAAPEEEPRFVWEPVFDAGEPFVQVRASLAVWAELRNQS